MRCSIVFIFKRQYRKSIYSLKTWINELSESLKRGFGRCDGLGGFDGLSGFGGYNGLDAFDRLGGLGGFRE